MADHLRKQIRHAVATRLMGHPGIAPENVYPGRSRPLRDDQLPALLVWTAEEQAERSSMGSMPGDPVIDRIVSVRVEARVKVTDGSLVDDVLDDLAIDTELLLTGADLGGLVQDLVIVETMTEILGDDLDAQYGAQALTFEAIYRTSQTDVTAPL